MLAITFAHCRRAAEIDYDVAGEIRNGTIRVELALASDRLSAIPLEHGQPGQVEIVVGTASPLELIAYAGHRLLRADASARGLPAQAAANASPR